jgi:uncharacterized membrane protein YccC
VPWSRAVRTALAVTVPFAVGLATGHADWGLISATGTLPASTLDRGGAHRVRLLRMGSATVAAALGYLLGEAIRGHGWGTVVAVTAVAAVSTLFGVLGAVASAAGLQLTIYTLIAAGRLLPPPWWSPSVLVLLGGAWTIGLAAIGWLLVRDQPRRDAVAGVFAAIAYLLSVVGTEAAEAARRSLTDALNAAYDAVFSARLREAGRDPETRELITLLNEATPVVEAAVTLLRENEPVPPEWPKVAAGLAGAIRTGSPPSDLPELPTASVGLTALQAAVASVVRVLRGRFGDSASGSPPPGTGSPPGRRPGWSCCG